MGNADRLVRVVLAVIVAVLYFTHIVTGALGVILLTVAGIFVLTSLISFCPLYTLLGKTTCSAENK